VELKYYIDFENGKIMKRIFISIVLLFSVLTISSKSYSRNEFSIMEGRFFGQNPPGMVAEPFAPGIISKEGWELEGMFTPGIEKHGVQTLNC